MEHSDRGRYVTNQVILWICNDGEHYHAARDFASDFALTGLGQYLTARVRNAKPYSAPWHVAQELAPNDYDRIDWAEVAESLRDH